MNKYIDRDKLAEFARHSTIGIDANDIMRFPTADVVEVKHGNWIELPNGWDGIDEYLRFECSECHREAFSNSLFCPHCGADMRERKETDE